MDGFTDITSPLELLELPKLSAINNHFTDLLTPRFGIEAESLNVGRLSIPQDHRDIADLLISDDINLDSNSFNPLFGCTMAPGLCARLHHNPMQSSSSKNGDTRSELSTGCRCMALAVGLLHKLFSPESPSSISGNSVSVSSDGALGSNLPTLTLLERNKETIEAVSNMLQCSCAETGYLTTMLSIIVFKVLELYAVAVRQVHHGPSFECTESPLGGAWSTPMATRSIRRFGTDSSSSDDEVSKRTSAQLILGELHHVQGIMNQLALRFNAHGERGALEQDLDSSCESLTSPPLLTDSCRPTETFSAATLGQIEADLRRGLTTLSSDIITRLRWS
ncbi:aflatoxin regulatory protein domain-containing protein [Pochonia chlamydosporia 170]|uniref:Aflatoxin regulatory protein domain-containing protein n=1 Tax=Pochonia chlamydosporia 170 TaxID=1380566 RepID=A0A179F1Z4_METCM|nr:aflatoxin regulatory protein domain-containing protein [Pochonia chlamydosporia 170]OAQ59466.2 aflatoxin regulatory protein domain-containing protein [Pochonia chlamydosporia 170]